MKIKNIGRNTTEVEAKIGTILISYITPVAVRMAKDGKYYRTEEKRSITTSKHIAKWLNGNKAAEKPQKFFDNLL